MKEYKESPLGMPFRRGKIIKFVPKEYLTAEQYLENNWSETPYEYNDIIRALVEFAQHHVFESKLELNNRAKILSASELMRDRLVEEYPIENIK